WAAQARRGSAPRADLSTAPLAGSQQPESCESVIRPGSNALQAALARRGRTGLRRQRLQALRRRCIERGPGDLSKSERSLLAQEAEGLQLLRQQVWRAAPRSPWGRLVGRQIVSPCRSVPGAAVPARADRDEHAMAPPTEGVTDDGHLPGYPGYAGQ